MVCNRTRQFLIVAVFYDRRLSALTERRYSWKQPEYFKVTTRRLVFDRFLHVIHDPDFLFLPRPLQLPIRYSFGGSTPFSHFTK